MTRRVSAALAAVAFILVACGGPAAPALTDPKEILTQSVMSLKDIKTISISGKLEGQVAVPDMGSMPLDNTTMSLAADIAAKKASVVLDAPSFLGTKVEAIVIDQAAWYKIAGPLAALAGADPTGKYTKVDTGAAASAAPVDPTDPQKAIDELRKALDELPSAPTKQADEKCGDVDCYHVNIALTGDQLAEMGTAGAEGFSLTFDVWSRKDNLRPAKLVFAMNGGEQGTVTATFDMTYDGTVTVTEPPADQVVTP